MLESRTEHLFWRRPEKGFSGRLRKHRRALFPDQVTPLASGLTPTAQCKLLTRLLEYSLAFRPGSLSPTFIVIYTTSEHLLVRRCFAGLGDSSIKRRRSFCPGGFTISLGILGMHIKVETEQSRPSSTSPFAWPRI